MQDYRKLLVWRRSHDFALAVRAATRTMPRRGFSRMIGQMNDAAESVVYNIVEGAGATTRKEFARFLTISVRSTMEVEEQLELARDARALSQLVWTPLGAEVVEIRRMLCGLRAAILHADDRP
jgi:four helix bundle protein